MITLALIATSISTNQRAVEPGRETTQQRQKRRYLLISRRREKDMPFIASNGLTEEGTSKTVAVGGMPGGMNVHSHDVGTGDPVLFLHSYGPGTTAGSTFYKTG